MDETMQNFLKIFIHKNKIKSEIQDTGVVVLNR